LIALKNELMPPRSSVPTLRDVQPVLDSFVTAFNARTYMKQSFSYGFPEKNY
jgi:hypothetical protein